MKYSVGDTVRIAKGATCINGWEVGDTGIVRQVDDYNKYGMKSDYWVYPPDADPTEYANRAPFTADELELVDESAEDQARERAEMESADDVFERQLNEVRRGVKASEVHA